MSPVGKALVELVPYAAVFLLGSLIPLRKGLPERIALGLVGVLSLVLVQAGANGGSFGAANGTQEWPHLLNLIIFLPMFGAVAVLFLPRQAPSALRSFTLVVLLADLAISAHLLGARMNSGWHYQYIAEWLPSWGIRYHVAIDGMSFWLLLLTTISTPVAFFATVGRVRERVKDFCFAVLLLHSAVLGAYVALDLFLFFVFCELTIFPLFFIIGVWGGSERVAAAKKFLLFSLTGSAALLAAILYLVWSHRLVAGYITFDYLALSHVALPRTASWLCFFAFVFAFAVKTPVFPFHTWLPDAHSQAPSFGSAMLAAIVLKLGAYGYLRFCMGMFAGQAWQAGVTLAGLTIVFGIIWGALLAARQDDLKRAVAYLSLSQMGYVMLGFFAGTSASLEGAMVQMLNHGVSFLALTLIGSAIEDRYQSTKIADIGGIARATPVLSALLVVAALGSIGFPGTSGFVAEVLVITGTFVSTSLGVHGQLQATLAALGGVIVATYAFKLLHRLRVGSVSAEPVDNRVQTDLTVRETIALAPLIALMVIGGCFPKLFLAPMADTVASMTERYREGRAAYLGMSPESQQPMLMPRRGGNLEIGYPKANLNDEAEPSRGALDPRTLVGGNGK